MERPRIDVPCSQNVTVLQTAGETRNTSSIKIGFTYSRTLFCDCCGTGHRECVLLLYMCEDYALCSGCQKKKRCTTFAKKSLWKHFNRSIINWTCDIVY